MLRHCLLRRHRSLCSHLLRWHLLLRCCLWDIVWHLICAILIICLTTLLLRWHRTLWWHLLLRCLHRWHTALHRWHLHTTLHLLLRHHTLHLGIFYFESRNLVIPLAVVLTSVNVKAKNNHLPFLQVQLLNPLLTEYPE